MVAGPINATASSGDGTRRGKKARASRPAGLRLEQDIDIAMRILVLGAGLQGSACAYDLLRREEVEGVTLADLRPGGAPPFLGSDPKLRKLELDFTDREAVLDAMAGNEVVLSAAPYYLNLDLARRAAEAAIHFADLGGNTEIVRAELGLDAGAREAGVAVVPDVGLAPGLADVLAWEGVRRLDRTRRVRMYVGGLPQHPKPPLDYQLVYSLEGTLDYYTTPSWILREGRPVQVEALSGVEELEFDEVGRLEAFHTAGGASLLPWELEGRVESLAYKTLRYPGHAASMRTIRDLGLLSEEPVAVDSTEVVPRQVFIACAEPRLTRADEPDLVALRVLVEGEREGKLVRLAWELLDRENPETGITAMERVTGFSLAIAGLLLGRGEIAPGAAPAYRAVPYEAYLAELERRGVRVRETEEAGQPAGRG